MAGETTLTGAAAGTAVSPGLGTVIGAGLGLVGDLIGGHSASSEAHKNRKEARRQFDIQTNESVQRRVQDALKAGINPLTALGANVSSAPTIHAGGESGAGEYISRAGSRLQRMIEDLTEEKAVNDFDYDNQVKSLDLESKRLENRILRNKALESDRNLAKGSGSEVPGLVVPNREGDESLFKVAYDLKGRPRLVVNQNILEGDSDNAGYTASLLPLLTEGHIDKLTGRIDEQYRLMLDDMYYNMYGRHISNLDDLYVSPTELGVATANALDQSGFSIKKLFGGGR